MKEKKLLTAVLSKYEKVGVQPKNRKCFIVAACWFTGIAASWIIPHVARKKGSPEKCSLSAAIAVAKILLEKDIFSQKLEGYGI